MNCQQLESARREVYQREQEAIRERREVQSDLRGRANISPDGVETTTVGLALSGGGVRSGAVSLGLLQSLDERRVLPYVDYLSTVSGGGYAGAYLSSAALNAQNNQGNQPDRLMLPISGTGHGAQPSAMMDFIHGGHFLKRTWAFFNRYAIGVLQVWMVVFSGLLALSSLVVWVFKQLDYPQVRSFIAALGFESDIALALFPSFVLFVVWVVAWGISYFRQQGRAPGVVAQFMFYVLLLVTVVAVAALLGTGDISLASAQAVDGRPPNQTINTLTRTVQTVLIGAIMAALLPYLAPRRLFRSGTSPESKPAERYLFWFASRALVFGVPFLLISFFARENISGWNKDRDDRLTVVETSDWDALHPKSAKVWVLPTEKATAPSGQQTAPPPKEPEPAETKTKTSGEKSDSNEATRWVVKWWNDDSPPLKTGSPDKLAWDKQDATQEERVANLFKRREEWSLKLNGLDSPLDDDELARLSEERVLGSEHLSRWRRWRYFWELLIQGSFSSREDWKNNRLYRIWEARMGNRDVQEAILAELNGNLSTGDFYDRFKPKGGWQALRDLHKGNQDHLAWVTRLEQAYDDANDVHARYAGTDVLDSDQERQEQIALLEQVETDEKARADASNILLRSEEVHRARIAAHRKLMQVYYDGAIQDKSRIYAGVVLEHDQRTRMTWFLWSAAIFVVSACMVSLNATSWHGYYATRLANMWTMPAPGMERNIPLAAMNTTKHGYPYHLVNGALQLMGRQSGEGRYVSRDHFLLSNAMCGSDRLGYCDTALYQEGRLTLADAIAISGGAFTPTQTSNPLLMTLLVLGNLRLGQWLDNPARCDDPSSWIKKVRSWLWVSPMRLLLRLPQKAERRPFCFVTDGGHHENLGIEPLLKRRCRLIIACDAGQDDQFSFLDFCKLLTRMRLEEGITIRPLEESETTIKLDSLVPESKQRYTKDHFLVAEICYAPSKVQCSDPKQKSYLIFIKSSLTGDEPTELVQYHRFNPSFPHDPTADQFYSAERFAAYTQLGSHIAEILCRRLPARLDQLSVDAFIRTISGEEERRRYSQCDTRQSTPTSESSYKEAAAFAALDGSFSTAPWGPRRKDTQEPRESIDQFAGTSGVHPSETAAAAIDDSAPPFELSNASELDAAMEQNIRIELGDGSAATRSKTLGDRVKTKTNSSKSNPSQNKSLRRKPR